MSTHDDLITALVVGQARSITLGVPVRPQVSEGIALREGRWQPSGGASESLWKRLTGAAQSKRPAAPVTRVIAIGGHGAGATSVQAAPAQDATPGRPWRKPSRKTIAIGLGGLSVIGAAALAIAAVMSLGHKDSPAQLPVAAVAPKQPAPPQAITMLAAPYDPNGAGLPLAGPGAASDTPVPAQVLAAASPEPTGVVVKPEAAPKEVPKEAPPAAPALKRAAEEKRPPPPAVIIDEAPAPVAKPLAPQPTHVQAPAAPSATASKPVAAAAKATAPAAAPAAALKASAPAAQVALAPASASKPALPRGTGLVTITPDGKIAVFSNLKTRMPEQYKLGDTLPNGETVRAIQPKEGKVITNAKEYSLD